MSTPKHTPGPWEINPKARVTHRLHRCLFALRRVRRACWRGAWVRAAQRYTEQHRVIREAGGFR